MARSFNGTSDAINCGGASGSLDIATNGTVAVSCFAIFNDLSLDRVLAGKGYDGTNQAYFLQLDPAAPGIAFEFGTYRPGVNANVIGAKWIYGAGISTGVWHHCYGDFDSAAWHLWFDGALVATTTTANGPVHTTEAFGIGMATSSGTPVNFFSGSLADVAVWNASLSTGEIIALSKGVRPYNIRTHTLLGYWPIDGLQSPEPDLSGNAHNGTLTGTALAAGPPVMQFTPRWPQFIPPPSLFTLMPQIVM